MRICKTFFIVFFFALSIYSNAQTDSVSTKQQYNKTISLSLAGGNFIYSVNYTSFLKENKYGYLTSDIRLTYIPFYSAANYSLQEYFGKKNHHFVIGVGYRFFNFHKDNSDIFAPSFDIGYCYYNPNKRLTYGIYFQPITRFEDTFLPWGGITLGYNFNSPKITWLESLYRTKEKDFSLYAGVETGFGKGDLELEDIGKRSANSFTSSVYLKYFLKHIYIKGTLGYYHLNENIIENNGSQLEILNNPSFLQYSIGLGVPLYQTSGWYISPEIYAGSYHSNQKLKIEPVQVPFNSNENLDYDVSDDFSTPYFFKAGLNISKSIFPFMDINAGCYYTSNCFLWGRVGYSYLKLKSTEYQMTLGIQIHL